MGSWDIFASIIWQFCLNPLNRLRFFQVMKINGPNPSIIGTIWDSMVYIQRVDSLDPGHLFHCWKLCGSPHVRVTVAWETEPCTMMVLCEITTFPALKVDIRWLLVINEIFMCGSVNKSVCKVLYNGWVGATNT